MSPAELQNLEIAIETTRFGDPIEVEKTVLSELLDSYKESEELVHGLNKTIKELTEALDELSNK